MIEWTPDRTGCVWIDILPKANQAAIVSTLGAISVIEALQYSGKVDGETKYYKLLENAKELYKSAAEKDPECRQHRASIEAIDALLFGANYEGIRDSIYCCDGPFGTVMLLATLRRVVKRNEFFSTSHTSWNPGYNFGKNGGFMITTNEYSVEHRRTLNSEVLKRLALIKGG